MNLINKVVSVSVATLVTCIGSTGPFINAKWKSTGITNTIVSTDKEKAALKKKYTQCANNINARYRGKPKLITKYLNKCQKP